jgi:hypothetical protein
MNETNVTLMTMRFEIPLHAQESNASECAAVPLTTGSKKLPKTLFPYIHTPTPGRGENFTLARRGTPSSFSSGTAAAGLRTVSRNY